MATADRQARGLATEGEGNDGREETRALARERLRHAVAGGDYDGLLDPSLWRLLDAAAGGSGFGREIGALRFAMARLLAEEEDPRHLATHLARVTTMIVRATQAQRQAVPTEDDPIRVALVAAVDELDGMANGDDEGTDDGEEPDADREEDGW